MHHKYLTNTHYEFHVNFDATSASMTTSHNLFTAILLEMKTIGWYSPEKLLNEQWDAGMAFVVRNPYRVVPYQRTSKFIVPYQ